ncbi:hypothetical protein ACOME3_003694 [Neoechinorhynchus agilis]
MVKKLTSGIHLSVYAVNITVLIIQMTVSISINCNRFFTRDFNDLTCQAVRPACIKEKILIDGVKCFMNVDLDESRDK